MERYIRLVLDPSTCKQVSVSSAQLRFDYGNFDSPFGLAQGDQVGEQL